MIITETVLCKAMNSAKGSSGYISMKDPKNGNIIISADSWCVEFVAGQTPRKVLGRLVEHIGKLPDRGEAIRVRKKEVQTELYDVAAERWESLKKGIINGQAKRIHRTHFHWKDFTVWQSPNDLRIMFFDPDTISLVKLGINGGTAIQNMMYFQGGVSSCFVCSTELMALDDANVIGVLEQDQWTK